MCMLHTVHGPEAFRLRLSLSLTLTNFGNFGPRCYQESIVNQKMVYFLAVLNARFCTTLAVVIRHVTRRSESVMVSCIMELLV